MNSSSQAQDNIMVLTKGESSKKEGFDLNVIDGSFTIPLRRKQGVPTTPGVELDSVIINLRGVKLAEGQSGYEFALEEARRSCPNHEPYHDHNPPPL